MKKVLQILFVVLLLLDYCKTVNAQDALLIETESFKIKGGWVVDQQFTDIMGSSYLLAHGYGKPVENAESAVTFPATGVYRIWVRTKDWIPDHPDHPGIFKVLIDTLELEKTFGANDNDWSWQDGGLVNISKTEVNIAIKDLTGFEGRCDAIFFTADTLFNPPNKLEEMKAWKKALSGIEDIPPSAGEFDLVVVGGGIAGCSAAIAAARTDIKVALIQDRPYLGGNSSQEIRVHTLGLPGKQIVNEINTPHYPNGSSTAIDYTAVRHDVLSGESNISLFLSTRAYRTNTNGSVITSVDARHIETGEELRFSAPIFIDCTGDGWIGFWAGAEYRMGREAKSEHNESLAPDVTDSITMGNTLLWNSREAGQEVVFPEVPWAMDVAKDYSATKGEWFWEYGFHLNTIYDAEQIRDHMFRAIYGSFYNAKQKAGNENRELEWVAYIAGKRESRRLIGDYVLTENDVRTHPDFPDGFVFEQREIDIHRLKPGNYDFLSVADFNSIQPYKIPFRCFYSINIDNLMMAGRCLSATHVGLGSPRVMNTCGQMGVTVGFAASLCKKYNTLPRGVYQSHIEELRTLLSNTQPPTGRCRSDR